MGLQQTPEERVDRAQRRVDYLRQELSEAKRELHDAQLAVFHGTAHQKAASQ